MVQTSFLAEIYCTEQAFSSIGEAFSLLKRIIFQGIQDLNIYNKNEHDNKHCHLSVLLKSFAKLPIMKQPNENVIQTSVTHAVGLFFTDLYLLH